MDLKKSNQASLENRRGTYFIIGLIVSFSLILISFEWTTVIDPKSDFESMENLEIDIHLIPVIRREEPKPEPKPELPIIKEVINIVPDDIEIEAVDFSNEVTRDTKYKFSFDDPVTEVIVDDPIPFVHVEDKPQFNGGDPIYEFPRYIARNLKYPEIAAENGVFGRVTVMFLIDETGSVTDPVILQGVDPALDAEAIRVILSSPKWTPGKQLNKPVKVSFIIPINFVLQ